MYDMRHPSGDRLIAESYTARYIRPTEVTEKRATRIDNNFLAIARASDCNKWSGGAV
jgi:hypothetical protein